MSKNLVSHVLARYGVPHVIKKSIGMSDRNRKEDAIRGEAANHEINILKIGRQVGLIMGRPDLI